ncbi:reverse transcriptase domain-containing protein [Tanacetum coccineum]
MKLLDTGIIYPIADSPWVSPIHCVPKKSGITVVTNKNDELVPTRTITGWRVCIDYRKLNEATAKDHFPLPFMDQMLERLAGNKYFCFLDGFSRYFQIPIDLNDQQKTTFTCHFGTYAYRRMPFGLCNAPATFQRCMLAIFHDMIEESVEVFMDDFSVFGNSFDTCLNNLDKILQRCKDAHLILNWEKCHFMVKEGIMLRHKVSSAGLEVDKAKIDVISKLSPPTNIKGIRSFLRRAGFYRRFIKDFLKIARPLTKLLKKDTPFEFNDECQKAFELLKERLTCAPVIEPVLGQKMVKTSLQSTLQAKPLILLNKNTQALKRILKKTVKDNPAIWSRKLDDALWAFRTAYKTPTGTTPYKLIYRKNCHLPFEIEHRAYWALKNCNPYLIVAGEKRMFQLHELDELRHQAYENSRLYKERTKVWHDRILRMRKEFKQGNKVIYLEDMENFNVCSKDGSTAAMHFSIPREVPSGKKDLVFVKSLADDTKVSIPSVKRPWLSEAEGFILPNHDIGRILPLESQRNTIDPSVAVTNSSATEYDSADESSVYSNPLPLLKKLDGVKINEPSSAPAKGNKSSSASKVNSTPAGKLKNVKIKGDPPLAIVIKELKDLKLQMSKNQSSHSRNNQQCERTDHRIYDHAEYISTMNMSQHLKSLGRSSSRSHIPRPSKRFFPPCIHYGGIDHLSNECLYYPCDIRNPIWYLDSGCSRHMTGVKSYLHKYEEQPGPKVVFRDDSTCITKGYGSIKCNGIVFTKFDEKRGTIFNSNKEVVMIAPRVRDVYVLDMTSSAQESFYIYNHKDHLRKFDEKDDDGYLLGYSLVSKAFRVFNTRRQQTKETYHITFDESPDAIKFLKPSVDNINIAENERYSPDEYLYPYEPSQRYQTNNNDVSFIEPYKCPEPVVLETKVSFDQNRVGILTRAMAKELGATLAHECLFVDFLSEKEPKKVSEAL